jgi:hypothetical protein
MEIMPGQEHSIQISATQFESDTGYFLFITLSALQTC